MALKRPVGEGGQDGPELPRGEFKRRHIRGMLFRGLENDRLMQETVLIFEPLIRNSVREEVERAISSYFRSLDVQNESSGSRTLQLRFDSTLPYTLFTGSKVLSEEKAPVKIILYDSSSNRIVTSGSLSSSKVDVLVCDGDFNPDDEEEWTEMEFNRKVIQNREGKRPLVTGDLVVQLERGEGYLREISFTDNSSWIRSGKFRLAAKLRCGSSGVSVREGISKAFKVKDHRGESYQKHYPPSLDDEVWRLEKIAKDGASHTRLTLAGITSVQHFLRLYVTNEHALRAILGKIQNKAWKTIIEHANSCALDNKLYMYSGADGTAIYLDSIYKVVAVSFDGHNINTLDKINSIYQRQLVEDLKQQAYRNLSDLVLLDQSVAGYPMLMPSLAGNNFNHTSLVLQDANFPVEQDQQAMNRIPDRPMISSSYNYEIVRDGSTFDFSLDMSDPQDVSYIGGPIWNSGASNLGSQILTDNLPADDFQVKSSAWRGSRPFLVPSINETGLISPEFSLHIPRNGKPKTNWCMVLAIVKWRILVRRNIAARKWRSLYM